MQLVGFPLILIMNICYACIQNLTSTEAEYKEVKRIPNIHLFFILNVLIYMSETIYIATVNYSLCETLLTDNPLLLFYLIVFM